MSKKKKKLDKKLIAERLRELEAEARDSQTATEVRPKKSGDKKELPHKPKQVITDSDNIIIHDLKRVAVLFAVIFIIFIGLYLFNLKTNYILTASDKIFTFLHIGQL